MVKIEAVEISIEHNENLYGYKGVANPYGQLDTAN